MAIRSLSPSPRVLFVLVLAVISSVQQVRVSAQGGELAIVYATTNANQLMTFASSSPGTSLSTVTVTGLQPGESILGIDIRPLNQALYALGSTSRLYTINPTTGAATQVGTGAFTPALSGSVFGIDFNPAVDLIRVVSDVEQNLQLNPDTGAVVAIDIDLNSPGNPVGNVVAAAYSNNTAGATPTTLYAIDSSNDQLMQIGSVGGMPMSANGGVLTVIGPLGFDTSTLAGFDIASTGTAYAALRVGGISSLFTIDLPTGAATQVGAFPAGSTFTGLAVKSAGPPPSLTLTPSTINFGASVSAGTISASTPAQTLTVLQNGAGPVSWTVSSNVPWLTVTPESGSGSGSLVVSLTPNAALLPSAPTSATITLTAVGSSNSPTATVNLNVFSPHQEQAPFGSFDTPQDGQAGVAGAIPVTGWVLDDIGVSRVRIFRSPIPSEAQDQLVFIGDAVFVAGARPDVASLYPTTPLKDQAGWGYMLLTNFLPFQGNGTFTLHAVAVDIEGRTTLLGSKTISCANSTATAPFGTIDTPTQGGTVSGSTYVNFGWALTPQPKIIPTDGSTIQVLIDSAPIGTVTYNLTRPDIQQLFPGYQNTDGPVGYRVIDTTALANGVHTIAWIVVDNQGAAAGIGSRYFTVANGGGSVVTDAVSSESVVIAGNRAAIDAPPAIEAVEARDVRQYRTVQLERLVVELGDGAPSGAGYRGYEIVDGRLVALPVGSHLDARTGEFAWAPGLAFGGTHQLLFVRSAAGVEQQIRVDVAIDPHRPPAAAARVVIDTPSAGAEVGQPFVVAGWAIDPAGPANGTGIDVLHVWAHPVDGSAPRFAGVAAYGGTRPDVAAHFGARFRQSGFGANVAGLPPGTYDVVVYGLSVAAGDFSVAGSVRVTVR